MHIKEFSPSMHSPCWQGDDRQSLMFVSQDDPLKKKVELFFFHCWWMRAENSTCKSWRTLAGVTSNGVVASAAISTWSRDTVVDVDLATWTGETDRTGTFEGVDEVLADTAVQTGLILTFVYVNFALCASETFKRSSKKKHYSVWKKYIKKHWGFLKICL